VGGYGQVGQVVSSLLGARYPGAVIAAGRSYEKAQSFAALTGGSVIPRHLDLDVTGELEVALDGVRLVVSCVERPDAALAARSLERGIGYVEVGGSLDALERTLALNQVAIRSNAPAIASVGLIPGLSNLLAADLARRLEGGTHRIDIFFMLGLGDTHGVDAIRWMLERMHSPFFVLTPQGPQRVKPLSDPVVFRFPWEQQPRTAYRIDFADQHVLPETVGAAGASTRLCFDSRLVTRLLGSARRTGLLRFANRLSPAFVARVLDRLPFGEDRYALLVIAHGRRGRSVQGAVSGRQEARATGLVTAYAAEAVLSGRVPTGVHHVEHVLSLAEFRSRGEREGMRFFLPSW
jgi:saccharopine dehydrogenase (NAD+, L-lysine forming)